ncbi:MAG: sigma-54-dependent Fis family transcriptional regulator [Negativicutes bacterium]|nr:sigma-54-dependent Fis family transcriptional regulator [Negativicutes bacterium]
MAVSYKAWEDFVLKKVTSREVFKDINPTILQSWLRCQEYGLNPLDLPSILPLSEPDILERQCRQQRLIEIAKPFLEKLYEIVKGSGFVVLLLDHEACVMELVGDQEILDRHSHFRIGECWNEETKGTNAMGLVKIEQRPLQVLAMEHYSKVNHWLTCSAAPIRGENDEMIGIIDVSGDCRHTHAHTLGMVVAASQAIENQLRLEAANAEITQSYNNIAAIIESMSEGLISFDNDGRITKANPLALKILSIYIDKWQGESLSDALANPGIVQDILNRRRKINDQEVFFDTSRGRVHALLCGRPIFDQRQEICGGVITLREIDNVHRLVTKMVGAVARFTFDDIVGASANLASAVKIAKTVAPSMSSVFLLGESGTGKEMFAQSIHNASPRAKRPFVAINCGAVPRELIESELFGYDEGAFTGAKRGGRPGKFEWANGGTIFLDEVGDMPLETQTSLLRVLQEKQVVRIGGYKPIPVNVRVIAATNRNVTEEVRKGNLRWDLYYRLNVISITIPPLRDREDDVLLLAEYFIRKFSEILQLPMVGLDSMAAEALMRYSWPGNVRELSNTMERAVNLSKGGSILLEHLPESLQSRSKTAKKGTSSAVSFEKFEKTLITDALQNVSGNISQCAANLGIGRNTLYRKLKKYNIYRHNI